MFWRDSGGRGGRVRWRCLVHAQQERQVLQQAPHARLPRPEERAAGVGSPASSIHSLAEQDFRQGGQAGEIGCLGGGCWGGGVLFCALRGWLGGRGGSGCWCGGRQREGGLCMYWRGKEWLAEEELCARRREKHRRRGVGECGGRREES